METSKPLSAENADNGLLSIMTAFMTHSSLRSRPHGCKTSLSGTTFKNESITAAWSYLIWYNVSLLCAGAERCAILWLL